MNYSELVVAVSDYCENSFPTVDMNVFIRQAEQRIYNTAQPANLRKNMTGTLSTNNKYLSAPGDFLSTYSLAVVDAAGDYKYLLNKDVNFIREAYPSSSATGLPKHYAIFGPSTLDSTELSFILGPTPNSNYVVELHFYYYPESIVTAGTSWLGDNFDSVLLYGTICEAYTYMKGEADMVKLAQDRYVQAIALYKNLADGKQRMDAYRDGQVRIAVS
jgi:hypothetical protein